MSEKRKSPVAATNGLKKCHSARTEQTGKLYQGFRRGQVIPPEEKFRGKQFFDFREIQNWSPEKLAEVLEKGKILRFPPQKIFLEGEFL